MTDDNIELNFEGKVSNQDVQNKLRVPVFIRETIDNKKKEDSDEN